MVKTLVIKGADFSQNYIERVTFSDKPCTSLSLNKASVTLENTTDTEILVATVTPADTTDTIIWISSDPDIVSVANGVISATGIGTATITVQCGDYSATCAVTCEGKVDFKASSGAFLYTTSSNDYFNLASITATDSFVVGEASGNRKATSNESADGWLYPIIMPKNATRLCVRCMTQYWGLQRIGYTLSTEDSSIAGVAKKISTINGASNLGWGDKTYNGVACYGNDVVLRSENDYDSVILGFKQQGSGDITPEVITGTHVWFET